jgi:PadR family transcriptional regulator AphA
MTARAPLLGEWACLGALHPGPAHGFAVAARLRADGDLGRVWSLSRPLTYRSISLLVDRGFVEPAGNEESAAGPTRSLFAATPAGRQAFAAWVTKPVTHLRDLRSELLMKLVLAEQWEIDVTSLLVEQHRIVDELEATLAARAQRGDVVDRWRHETARGALRFLDDECRRHDGRGARRAHP